MCLIHKHHFEKNDFPLLPLHSKKFQKKKDMSSGLPEEWERGVVHNIKDAIHAHRGLYGHRMKSMRDAFNSIDRNHDRRISPSEFADAMHRLYVFEKKYSSLFSFSSHTHFYI